MNVHAETIADLKLSPKGPTHEERPKEQVCWCQLNFINLWQESHNDSVVLFRQFLEERNLLILVLFMKIQSDTFFLLVFFLWMICQELQKFKVCDKHTEINQIFTKRTVKGFFFECARYDYFFNKQFLIDAFFAHVVIVNADFYWMVRMAKFVHTKLALSCKCQICRWLLD